MLEFAATARAAALIVGSRIPIGIVGLSDVAITALLGLHYRNAKFCNHFQSSSRVSSKFATVRSLMKGYLARKRFESS
jgi:hypothetical protein